MFILHGRKMIQGKLVSSIEFNCTDMRQAQILQFQKEIDFPEYTFSIRDNNINQLIGLIKFEIEDNSQ